MRSRPVGIMLVAILSCIAVAQYAALAVLSVVNERAVVAYLHVLSPVARGPKECTWRWDRFNPCTTLRCWC